MNIFKKEKEVVKWVLEYLDVAESCIQAGEKFVVGYLTGELENPRETADEINQLESNADDLRRSITDTLFSGAYLPLMRGDIHGLVESIDRVPNAAESCATMVFAEQPEIPTEFKDSFVEITRDSFGAIRPLKKVVKSFFKPKGDIETIREGVHEVSVLESDVDNKELELSSRIFRSSSLELSSRIHLREVISRIVRISDRAENTADRLILIAMKSVS